MLEVVVLVLATAMSLILAVKMTEKDQTPLALEIHNKKHHYQ
jgi:hypothetical protein